MLICVLCLPTHFLLAQHTGCQSTQKPIDVVQASQQPWVENRAKREMNCGKEGTGKYKLKQEEAGQGGAQLLSVPALGRLRQKDESKAACSTKPHFK